ncbi:MAG: UDP-N-acetylglucosamine 2-epimerase (hydrolyzing) [Gammaproteobacteria bacterium]|nr:UDP-N-acetylglucosamine 2-epimerase (hydrolyzing) [Gammaproteobacteria bacterium]
MAAKVCFISLSRSDYASLRPVIRAAQVDAEIEATVVAGGSHLLQRFGNSIENFKLDGIEVNQVIDFLDEQDNTELDIARAHGRAYRAFVEYLHANQPDSVFILGDRWEMLAVATAASLLRIPIFHHSGGDITQGSQDNQTRYALSALAHFHLVALQQHRQRLLHLGEEDWRVISVGEPALTEIAQSGIDDIRAELGLRSNAPFVLATYHPTTFESMSFSEQVRFFVAALDLIEIDIVLTAPNPDPGSNTFYEVLQNYADRRANVYLFENLGAERYYAAMNEAEYMIGNSSSGIWEAPSFGLPVINLGKRQQDRLRGPNVIDVELDLAAVGQAFTQIDELKSSVALRQKLNPYVMADTVALILNALKMDITRERLLNKVFVDPLTRQ